MSCSVKWPKNHSGYNRFSFLTQKKKLSKFKHGCCCRDHREFEGASFKQEQIVSKICRQQLKDAARRCENHISYLKSFYYVLVFDRSNFKFILSFSSYVKLFSKKHTQFGKLINIIAGVYYWQLILCIWCSIHLQFFLYLQRSTRK